jgi:hypothetical protein
MTAPPIDFWNIFHDGAITAADEQAGSVRLFISIGYLRRRMSPLGGGFVVTLRDVTLCEFRHFDGETVTLPEALKVGEPEILSTDSESLPVTIHTTLGQIVAAYGGVEFALDTGEIVSFADIASAATSYWDDFESRRKALQDQ